MIKDRMRWVIFCTCMLLLAVSTACIVEEENNEREETGTTALAADTTFDKDLAAELGADEYGMRKYIMAFLKAGPNRDQDSTEAVKLQRAHLDNINRLAEEGKLVLAGPFMDSGEVRGIYIFDVKTVEQARQLTETDPAIKAGRLEMELHPWYGSAALMQVNSIHNKISKNNP